MPTPRALDLAMKIVDADETAQDSSSARPMTLSGDEDTHVSPGLRPDVLIGAEQQRTRATVKAALFGDRREAPTIGRFRVLTRLGEGAMGVVYAAYDDRLDRKVALKLLRGAWVKSPEGRERAIREARALARLSHPHVVHVYEAGEAEDDVYVAMEFLTGPTLRGWLEEAPRRWQDIVGVFRQAAEGLAAAHREGVIHRDFKPANAIFGSDGRVRVVDFGLAHFEGAAPEPGSPAARALLELRDGGLTQTGAVLGTPAYMAPEQFAGRRGDARSDQYSFCTALYEALYHQRPFDGDTLHDRWKAAQAGKLRPPPAGSDAPAWLFRALARGLQPDPADRWPSIDALLLALAPAPSRSWPRLAAAAGALSATTFAGMAYVFTLERPPPAPVDDQVTQQALAAAAESADGARLTEARGLVVTDPAAAVAALAGLRSDDPTTWQRARTLAAAAELRGLPAQILRAGAAPLAQVRPLAGGGLIARDDLGAVWRWAAAGGEGEQVLPPGSAEELLAARDVAAWVAIGHGKARVFVDGEPMRELDLGHLDPKMPYDWTLAADGRALAAEVALIIPGRTRDLVALWDLRDPAAPPRTIPVAGEGSGQTPAFSDDLSLVAVSEFGQLRLVRRGEPNDRILKLSARVKAISADRRFVIAAPFDTDDEALDVIDLETGTTRRVEAGGVVVLSGADVVFTRTTKKKLVLRRESLATGEVAWHNHFPLSQGGVLVDPAHTRYAVAMPDPGTWAIGDLASGRTATYTALLKDVPPTWAGDGALLQPAGPAVRVYRPDAAPLQVRFDGHRATLSPDGRFAVVVPHAPTGEFSRVELATGEAVVFRCPTAPTPKRIGNKEYFSINTAVDDAGQVVMNTSSGWNCWWDEVHGARAGGMTKHRGLVALPRGVAAFADDTLELWQQPDAPARAWPLPGEPHDLTIDPSGTRAAVRADGVVHVLNLATGADAPLPAGPARPLLDQAADALAWSPDGARLAVLDRQDGALRLGLWDAAGDAPRELAHHDLTDSPGLIGGALAFTPSGAAVALTDRDASLALLDLATGARRQLALPRSLKGVVMRSETEALGVDDQGVPVLADFAGGEAMALAPDPDRGFSSNPELRPAADGSLWLCDALGAGTVLHLPAPPPTEPAAARAWIHALAR